MIHAATKAVEQTKELAAAVAGLARPGDIVLLSGDLGAGKTAFVQGFAAALGITDHVTSPTFTIARSYEGPTIRLHHLDVYRLDHLQEAEDLGLAELVDDGAVTLIEWGEAVAPVLPADYLAVALAYGDADDDRLLSFRPIGPRWSARTRALTAAVQPWQQVGDE
jgi:tRNA threonylcarbamoyladenosine biosynthesis protein TsaE